MEVYGCICKDEYLKYILIKIKKKSLLVLLSGAAGYQSLSLLSIYLIGSYIEPDVVGVASLVLSLVSVISVFSSLRYNQAILLPHNIIYTKGFVVLSLISAFFIALIALILSYVCEVFINNSIGGNYIYSLYIFSGVIILSIFNVLSALSTKYGDFKGFSFSKIIQALSKLMILSLFIYVENYSVISIILSTMLGMLFSVLYLNTVLKSDRDYIFDKLRYSRVKLYVLIKRFKDFPLLSAPFVGLLELEMSMLILVGPLFFSTYIVGQVAFVYGIVRIGGSLLADSLRRMVWHELGRSGKDPNLIKNIIKHYSLSLIVIASILMFLGYLTLPVLIDFLFQTKWDLGKSFIPAFFIFMLFHVFGDIAQSWVVLKRQQKKLLLTKIVGFLIVLIGVLFSSSLGFNINAVVWVYSISAVISRVLIMVLAWKVFLEI